MSTHNLTPILLALIAALLWGIWWIPIRYLETLGMSGAQSGTLMNAGAAGAAFLWLLVMRITPRIALKAALGAGFVGVAISTYSMALSLGDVVRIVLLFYLAPAWSKIIEWAFMGQRWSRISSLTLAASLAGAYLVLGGEISLTAFSPADVLALLSGMAWSSGAALIFTSTRASPVMLSLITALTATVISLSFVLIGQGAALSFGLTRAGAAFGAGFGVLYVLPILALTLWSAQRLSPAVITFLLTAEILAGVITAALFLDEPFGVMQASGAGLIIAAAMAEVLKSIGQSKSANTPPTV
jgi:drug/metabolite transporter (DMT)-like permease